MHDPLLDALCDELSQQGCHTLILYGSRANGDATAESDYDLAGFWPRKESLRDARDVQGAYLDAFIYPERWLNEPHDELLKLRGGRVLRDDTGQAPQLLAGLEARFLAGPAPLAADDIATRRAWPAKMLARIARGDAEGHFRRAWLLTALLEDYFALRSQWYLGPKRALQWLREHDAHGLALFEAALQPHAELAAIHTLAEWVINIEE